MHSGVYMCSLSLIYQEFVVGYTGSEIFPLLHHPFSNCLLLFHSWKTLWGVQQEIVNAYLNTAWLYTYFPEMMLFRSFYSGTISFNLVVWGFGNNQVSKSIIWYISPYWLYFKYTKKHEMRNFYCQGIFQLWLGWKLHLCLLPHPSSFWRGKDQMHNQHSWLPLVIVNKYPYRQNPALGN